MIFKDFEAAVLEINKQKEKADREKRKTEHSTDADLNDYSPWLSSFQADNFIEHLEIPGELVQSTLFFFIIVLLLCICCLGYFYFVVIQ